MNSPSLFGRWMVAAVACAAVACTSDDAVDRPVDGRGALDAGGRDGALVDARGGAVDGGEVEADGGSMFDGDSGSDAGGDASDAADGAGYPPPPTALCNPSTMWGAGALLGVSTAADDVLDAVTPDELSIAWTSGSGATTAVEYADRASKNDPFGAAQLLVAGLFTGDRVALSADGLRMVVVDADGQGFSELTRASRMPPGNTFGAASVGGYTNFVGALATGQSYGDPVLSADDHAFYYSVYGGGVTATVHRSARLFANDAWPLGGAVNAAAGLAAQGAMRRRPTGISSDDQTLFFWDEVTGGERAVWIDETTGAFDSFVDLGARGMATPNAACDEIYFSAAGASSVDLFAAGE